MNETRAGSPTIDPVPPEEPGAQAISFVVRIWKEPTPTYPELRGWIEHVQTGQRTFFLGLDRVPTVIAEHIGVRPGRSESLRSRLMRWRIRLLEWFSSGAKG